MKRIVRVHVKPGEDVVVPLGERDAGEEIQLEIEMEYTPAMKETMRWIPAEFREAQVELWRRSLEAVLRTGTASGTDKDGVRHTAPFRAEGFTGSTETLGRTHYMGPWLKPEEEDMLRDIERKSYFHQLTPFEIDYAFGWLAGMIHRLHAQLASLAAKSGS